MKKKKKKGAKDGETSVVQWSEMVYFTFEILKNVAWSNTTIHWLLNSVFETKEMVQETLNFSWSHKTLHIYGWRVNSNGIKDKPYLAEL